MGITAVLQSKRERAHAVAFASLQGVRAHT